MIDRDEGSALPAASGGGETAPAIGALASRTKPPKAHRPLAVLSREERPDVKLRPRVDLVATDAIRALATSANVYTRDKRLVRVVRDARPPQAASDWVGGMPVIRELGVPDLTDELAASARFVRRKIVEGTETWPEFAPPRDIVQIVLSRGEYPNMRPLHGVRGEPFLRPDGSVCQRAGYDPATGILVELAESFVEVPERPTRDDARGAANAILDLVCDFPFASEADRSAWLATVLTIMGRPAIDGPVPFFAIDANTRGSGKSKLVDLAVMITQGHKAPRMIHSAQDEEMRKMITSVLREGAVSVLLDNVKGTLGCTSLDALLTGEVWKDRLLSQSVTLTVPATTVWFASGNNMQPVGDLARRTLRIRLRSPLENPEDRETFKYPDVLAAAKRRRPFLVAQALIILRAHAIAGRPASSRRSWGSFEAWSPVVANAITWLDLADPRDCRMALEDPSRDRLAVVIDAWHEWERAEGRIVEGKTDGVTLAELLEELYPDDGRPLQHLAPHQVDLRRALEEWCPPGRGSYSAKLGANLSSAVERVVGERFLFRSKASKSKATPPKWGTATSSL